MAIIYTEETRRDAVRNAFTNGLTRQQIWELVFRF